MTCPRITHAIRSSGLSAPLKHTLRLLTDHINSWKDLESGEADHTRPATLEVYEAVATLAADTGYSKPTVMLHLLKLRGYIPIPGQPKEHWPQEERLAVLELVVKSRQQRAARYRFHLDRLEALQRSKNLTPEPSEDAPQGSRNLTAERQPAVKFSGSSGQVSSPEYSHSLPQHKKNFLAHAPEAKKIRPDPTPPPTYLNVSDTFMAWFKAEVPALDLGLEREAFLSHCRRNQITNRYWEAAFKDWLLKAYGRYQRGESCASHPHPGGPVAPGAPTTPTRREETPRCSFAGCDAPVCGHGPQACRAHGWGACSACLAATRAGAKRDSTIERPPPVEEARVVSGESPTGPPEAEGIPLAVADALVDAFAQQHTMPVTSPTPRPLGMAPPRRRGDGSVAEEDPVDRERAEALALEQDPDYLAWTGERKRKLLAQAKWLAQAEQRRAAWAAD